MADPFNEKERTQFAGIGLIILRTIINANLMLISLTLSYNSYKEYVRGPNNIYHFPVELKVAIKSTFPLTIWIFSILFFFCNTLLWRNTKDSSLYIVRYFIIFASQGIILSYIFLQSGIAILIVQNLAIVYLALFILSWSGIKRLWAAIEKMAGIFEAQSHANICVEEQNRRENSMSGWIGGLKSRYNNKLLSFFRFLHINILLTKSYLKERPSALFLLGFMVLLAICSFLLIFKQEKIAKEVANIAYLLLVIEVGVEAYHISRLNKRKEHDESN